MTGNTHTVHVFLFWPNIMSDYFCLPNDVKWIAIAL